MADTENTTLRFASRSIQARILDASGSVVQRDIEVRTHPVTGRRSRITFSRGLECEPGTHALPPRPPDADDSGECPFCPSRIETDTPQIAPDIHPGGRMRCGDSILFPNLYPYGAYSAVSLFGRHHFVEIGTADAVSYADSFMNCATYLKKVVFHDHEAVFTAITQNHLPAAGGSLVHPHLQVHADRVPSNHHDFLEEKAADHFQRHGSLLWSDYLDAERCDGRRMIGTTGRWDWLSAFAPEGFFEIWAVLPGETSLFSLNAADWHDLAVGVTNTQKFYRSLCRNSYNLGLLSVEREQSSLELRVVLMVRANYAPWVRNDITGYEMMLGDMATFNAPEETAANARPFW